MRLTKIINLSFANSQQATTNIHVPFMVQSLHVHQIAYNNTQAVGSHKALYGYITSNLTDGNQPLGLYYQDNTNPYNGTSNNVYEFRNPTPINGTYTFDISLPTLHSGTDELLLIIEFHG